MLVISDANMKLGVNNNVNRESHKASLKHMAGGPSKINPPNGHPSNPIHKKATEAQGLAVKKEPTQTPATASPATQTQTSVKDTPATKEDSDDSFVKRFALLSLLLDFLILLLY